MKTVRAVSHVHSCWSYDGKWTLEQLAQAFRRRRCSVILSAEHDRSFSGDRLADYRLACARASAEGPLIVPGIEYSDPSNTTHVIVWGDVPFMGEGLSTGELLESVERHGGIAVLAHPWRKDAWDRFDPAWIEYLFGIELWNRKSDGWRPEPRVVEILDRTGLLPFAALDFHRSRQFFPLRMRITVDGGLSESTVLEAIRARRCRPMALGLHAEVFTHGRGAVAAARAEQARTASLRALRRAKYRRRSGPGAAAL